MFDWITRNVRNAVLRGWNEALAELAGATVADLPAPVRLLPSPLSEAEDEPARVRKGKAS